MNEITKSTTHQMRVLPIFFFSFLRALFHVSVRETRVPDRGANYAETSFPAPLRAVEKMTTPGEARESITRRSFVRVEECGLKI